MVLTERTAGTSASADKSGPAPFDLERTRALVAPLYENKTLRTGEPFLAHAVGIAEIIAPLRGDPDLIVAAYLFGVHDVLRDPDEWLRSRFGPGVAQLVADLRQLMRLSELTRTQSESEEPGRGRPGRSAAPHAAGDGQ
jgi:GTP pyrophosphokinase